MSRRIVYTRPKKDPEDTLLGFLARKFTYLSAEQWLDHICAGNVFLNSTVAKDPNAILSQRDVLQFAPPRSLEPPVDEEHIDFLYEDEALIACAKNGNLPVTEGGRYCQNTLIGVLHRRRHREAVADSPVAEKVSPCETTVCPGKADNPRKRNRDTDSVQAPPSPNAPDHSSKTCYFSVHRLDKETSGIVVLAKSSEVANAMRQAFEAQSDVTVPMGVHESLPGSSPPLVDMSVEAFDRLLTAKSGIRKVYVALLAGVATPGEVFVVHNRIGTVGEHPHMKEKIEHQKLRKLKMVCAPLTSSKNDSLLSFGKDAVSKVTIEKTSTVLGLSLARVEILTGRSHQIRVHCAHIGYPVLGDKLYTTSQPGKVGFGFPVNDDVYLSRVRALDSDTGNNIYASDAVQPQWACRRHCLHAAELTFQHPVCAGAPLVHLVDEAKRWFLRDIRPCATSDASTVLISELEEFLS